MFNLKEILERYPDNHLDVKPVDAELARRDAWTLALFVRSRVARIHNLTESKDLCPVCAGYTWGRPQQRFGGMDFTRRQCNECTEIRSEPPEDLGTS